MEKVYFRLTCMAGSMTSFLAWGTLLRERSDLSLQCITPRAQIGEFFASFLTNAYHSVFTSMNNERAHQEWLSLKNWARETKHSQVNGTSNYSFKTLAQRIGHDLAQHLGLIIVHGRSFWGHMVRASFCWSGIRHQNALTETAWEDAVQALGKTWPIQSIVTLKFPSLNNNWPLVRFVGLSYHRLQGFFFSAQQYIESITWEKKIIQGPLSQELQLRD